MAYSLVPRRPVLSCVTAYSGNVFRSLWKRLSLCRKADSRLRWSRILLMSCRSHGSLSSLLNNQISAKVQRH